MQLFFQIKQITMKKLLIYLIDDDGDDRDIFNIALKDIDNSAQCIATDSGINAIQTLQTENEFTPDYIFLDLNMPRKTGFECLTEIKLNQTLKSLPIIIYSTSLDIEVVNLLYEKGAHHYIRKPGEFSDLKKVILEVLTVTVKTNSVRPAKEKFVIQV